MLTRAALEELLERAYKDPLPFFRRAFWITTKGLPGQPPLLRLDVNAPQRRIDEAIKLQRQNGLPPRVIVLKARQPGISTYAEARVTHTALTRPYTTSLIVSHLDEGVQKLFRKCTFGIDRLPPEIKPVETKRKTVELTFSHIRCLDGDYVLGSNIVAASAAGAEIWRGMTIHTAHLSEFAFFPRPESALAGLMQAVPKSPDSLVIIESTANGEGNCFHNEWVRAEAGESGFVPIFIPWWELPDAWMPVPKDFELEEEEIALKKAFGLTDEQIQWRRFVLYTELQGDQDLFQQEYPATAQEAFLTTGRPAFPVKPLHEMYERARNAQVWRGDVILTEETGPTFIEARNGPLAVYVRPTDGHDYCIGGDPSAGVEGGDPSALSVFDRGTDEIVAVWHGYISPIEFGQKMMALGKFYNDAWLAPEITGGHGFVVIDEIKRNFYGRVYVYQRVDKIRNQITNFLGWETTFRTRGLLLDSMHWAIGQHAIMIWDLPTIVELRQMRYLDPRKAEGLVHDDLAMACMIAYRAHLEMPMLETGMPPRIRVPVDKKPVSELPPMPKSGISKVAWTETDKVLRTMRHSRRRPLDEWGQMPDPDDDEVWEPGAGTWLPEIPW